MNAVICQMYKPKTVAKTNVIEWAPYLISVRFLFFQLFSFFINSGFLH
jgi:hypothetical protein